MTPEFKPTQSVPFAALGQVNEELDRLKRIGIKEKISHSKWAAPAVYIKKKKIKICICADFLTALNSCLKTYNNLLPSPEEIFSKLSSRRIFSKLDLSKVYLEIQIENERSELMTINMHRQLYMFN